MRKEYLEEGEEEIEQGQTLYSALTELLNEVPPTREELTEAQLKDEFCLGIQNYLLSKDNEKKKSNKPPNWMEKIGGYRLDSKESTDKDALLVYFNPTFDEELNDSGNGFKAVVPRSLIKRVMFACHGHPLSGHAGISKTIHRTKQIYYWPKMSRHIRVYVRSCQHCQQYKPNQGKKHAAPYVPHNMTYPWETICVDLCGPKPNAKGNLKWILVIIDQCTKYVELFSLAIASAKKIVEKINEYCVQRILCKEEHYDGSYEHDVHSHWPKYLNEFAFASQTQVSESLGHTPMLLNTGKEAPLPFDPRILYHGISLDKNRPEDYVKNLLDVLSRAHQNMYHKIQKNYERHEKAHNDKYHIYEYELGDIVWKKIEKSINTQDLLSYIPSYLIEEWEENQLVGTNEEHSNPE
uniref:Integrase zinc-binding domain-containing protein n=1 Tax=Strigamia maritima TaxID=126957 RepID=T1IHP9_STRMM